MEKNTRRSDAYFGLHFDFHAVESTAGIGTKTKAEQIARYLDAVKPDYIQVDTKGHPGYASYCSEYGSVAPGLACDHLKILREETKKRGIILIAHHSGVYDVLACKTHPEWAAMNEDGSLSDTAVDVTSAYADEKMVPQLRELAEKYGFEGAWIDGDCWAVLENYRPAFLKEFYRRSGFSSVGKRGEPSYLAFRQYCKDRFKQYLSHYITAVKQDFPAFEITSNYAFSTQMPEKPSDEIDFLSADASTPQEIRIVARSFAGSGKLWDIMSWGMSDCFISNEGGFGPQAEMHISRLCRSAAMAVSHGGGYQVVNSMTPQGEIRMCEMENMRHLSEFLRVRKPFNFHSVPLKNAAVLFSEYNREQKREDNKLYGKLSGEDAVCDMILDGGRPVDIIFDYEVLDGSFADRKTIILPELCAMPEDMKQKLREFTKAGGNLVVCGVKCCEKFLDMAQAELADTSKRILYMEADGYMYGINAPVAVFEKKGAEDICICHTDIMDFSAPVVSAAITNQYGEGKVVFVGWDIFTDYERTRLFSERETMRKILDYVEPNPAAYLEQGPKRVEIVPAVKGETILINLINTNEFYCDKKGCAFDDIAPVCGLTIAVRCEHAPASVMLEPEHIPAQYTYDGTYLHIDVDRVDIHTIIEIK